MNKTEQAQLQLRKALIANRVDEIASAIQELIDRKFDDADDLRRERDCA